MMFSLLKFSSIPLTTILIEYHTQGTLKVLMTPSSRCSITDMMFGGEKKKNTLKHSMWNSWDFGWSRDIVQHHMNFKSQHLTGKELPHVKDKALMKSVQQKITHCPSFLV